jgi:hypothetical protein
VQTPKQKLNTKSSYEAELIGATDYLPSTIWSKMFMESQGYEIKSNIFEQDQERPQRVNNLSILTSDTST